MAGNNKHLVYSVETDTVPRSLAAAGTISTVNGLGLKVVGVGTTFLETFQVGEFIFIPAEKECRRIDSIESDTELTISEAFTTTILAGQVYRKTPRSNFSMISYLFDATGGTIDGVAPPQGNTFDQGSKGGQRAQRIDPLVIEALGVCNVTLYQG